MRDRKDDGVEWLRATQVPTNLPRPVVIVQGVWDLLHSGHMRVLFTARERAGKRGTVVCGMMSDRWLVKNGRKPVMNWVERATALAYMPVDLLVEIDGEGDYVALVDLAMPD